MIATAVGQSCSEIQQRLDQWRGHAARLWEFSPSLDTLTVRLTAEERPGNLHLFCSPCVRLKAPVHWEHCNLQVLCRLGEDGSAIFVICDEPADVEISCRQVAVAENVEPMF